MTIALALDKLLPAAAYEGSLTDDTQASYDALVWNDPRTKPSWADIEAALAAPPPPPTVADLLSHASAVQNARLAEIWRFDVGTADAPLVLTTRLDAAGDRAMTKLALWAILNASSTTAREAYSNVDYSSAELTPQQALSLASQAGAVISASYKVLNEAADAIRPSAPAAPATITSLAAIDALDWPVPGA